MPTSVKKRVIYDYLTASDKQFIVIALRMAEDLGRPDLRIYYGNLRRRAEQAERIGLMRKKL